VQVKEFYYGHLGADEGEYIGILILGVFQRHVYSVKYFPKRVVYHRNPLIIYIDYSINNTKNKAALFKVFSLLAVNQEQRDRKVIDQQEIDENIFLRPEEQGVGKKNAYRAEHQHKDNDNKIKPLQTG
jgi:hypothetical protein